MLTKKIKYENLDHQMVEKDFYFSLGKADLLRLEMEHGGRGFEEAMRTIINADDHKVIMAEFERIILMTVGYRDGDDFLKSEDYTARFRGSDAYGELLVELCTNAQAAADFINGVIPQHLAERVRNMPGRPQDYLKKEEKPVSNVFENNEPQPAAPIPAQTPTESAPVEQTIGEETGWDYTREELVNLSSEEFERARANGFRKPVVTYDSGTEAIAAVDRANIGGLHKEHPDAPIFPPYDN